MTRLHSNFIWSCFGAFCVTIMATHSAQAQDQKTPAKTSKSTQATTEKTQDDSADTIVVVGDSPEQLEFRPKSIEMGPLGNEKLQDVPYAATVLNQAQLKDRRITGLNDALKYDSSTQMEARGGIDVGRPQARGMEGSVEDNSHLDGMNVVSTTAQPMELYQRVEIIHSLTGAVYGPATPAGDFNFEFKRPTADYFNEVSMGIDSNGARKASVDVGGTPNQYAGYRINVIKEQGDGYVSGSTIDRKAFGAAFDIYPTEKTTVEINASYYRFKKFGFPGTFFFSSSTGLPNALDPTKKGYGQSYAGSDLKTKTGSIKLKQEFNDNWKGEVGVLHQTVDRTLSSPTNHITGDGTFSQTISTKLTVRRFRLLSNEARLNGHFYTGDIEHHVTVGTTGRQFKNYQVTGNSGSTVTLGTGIDINNPQTFDEPTFYTDGNMSIKSKSTTQSAILGDTINWTDQWSTLLVGSYSHFDTKNASSSNYHKGGYSSTEALMYKPWQDTTTYVAYSDTLEAGQVVDNEDYTNDGETLAPFRSRQIETGVKQNFGRMDGSVALFRIKRPKAYAANDVYAVQGMQRNYGAELGLNGNVTDQVKMMANTTYLDAKLTKAMSATANDKRVIGVPKLQANVLTEYDFTSLPGFSVNANVHYVGNRPGDAANTVWLGSYTTLDLGAKYVTKALYGKKLTLRFNVDNVTNKRYWAASFPTTAALNGSTSSGTMAFLGEPLQANLTASIEF